MDDNSRPPQVLLRSDEMDAIKREYHELDELQSLLQRDCNILRDRARDNIPYLTKHTHHDTQDNETIISRARELIDYEFNMRQFIRAFFALVEAMVFRYKQYAIALPQDHYTFTQDELDIANETGGRKIRFYDNLDYSVDYLTKAFNISFKLDKGSQEFRNFVVGVKVRDRLMHPKRMEDVSPRVYDDYEKAIDGSTWYYNQMATLLEQVQDQLQNAQLI
jgi:hypothetical protein